MKHPVRWLLAAVLSWWLAGCGPGVGGTGTGQDGSFSAFFGATAASVCTSRLPTVLGCIVEVDATSAPVLVEADRPLHFADDADPPRVVARLEGSRLQLRAPCLGLEFSGHWGEAPQRGARFYGEVRRTVVAALPQSLPGSLAVAAPEAGGSDAVVTLRDADETVLLGPLRLQRRADEATPATECAR